MFITKCHCPHHSESCVHTHLAVYPDAGSVPSLGRLAQGLMWPSEVVRYDLATPGPDKYRANSKVQTPQARCPRISPSGASGSLAPQNLCPRRPLLTEVAGEIGVTNSAIGTTKDGRHAHGQRKRLSPFQDTIRSGAQQRGSTKRKRELGGITASWGWMTALWGFPGHDVHHVGKATPASSWRLLRKYSVLEL